MPPSDATTFATSITSSGYSGPPLSNRVTRPHAPSRIDRAASSFIRSSSAGVGGPGVVALHHQPDLLERHLRDHVHRDALRLQGVPVAGEVGPGVSSLRAGRRAAPRIVLSPMTSSVTPSRTLLSRIAVVQQRLVRVGVHVDEARRDDQAARIDLATWPSRRRVCPRRQCDRRGRRRRRQTTDCRCRRRCVRRE